MTDNREVTDVLSLVPPAGTNLDDPDTQDQLDRLARLMVLAQWPPGKAPGITWQAITHHVTSDPARVDELQPPKHCPTCRLGNEKVREYMSAHPGEHVVLVTISYVESWPR